MSLSSFNSLNKSREVSNSSWITELVHVTGEIFVHLCLIPEPYSLYNVWSYYTANIKLPVVSLWP